MSTYDLLLRGGTLVTAESVFPADLAIAEGQIVEIAPELTGSSREIVDARGLHIFPGLIDAHVHFNEPGRTEWEGFITGSRALAAGGVTAFFDMPLNASPPTLDRASFALKYQAARANSLVDFAFWGGIVPDNLDCLEELAECGVIGFKAFMSNSGIDDFAAADDVTLYEGMLRAAQLGKVVAVHAENDQMTSTLSQQAIAQGKTGIRDYLASRPVIAELEAISRAILFAQEVGCALHIVHVSTGRGVAMVAEARLHGINVSCETCPHYLVLTEEDMERLGAVAKCAPPLRSQNEQARLWEHVRAGNVQFVTTDHSPAPEALKQSENFFAVWGGISGCQSLLSLLITEGSQLPLSQIAALTSAGIASRFQLGSHKGHVCVGADADLCLVDLNAHFRLEPEQLYYRHQQSPYTGRTMRGRVVRTIVRGSTVFHHGNFTTHRGQLITVATM